MSYKIVVHSCKIEVNVCSLTPEGGWDTCIQATEGASMCLSKETSSTGMIGEPLHLRSSPSDVCGTCSGIREGAILPLHLPPPQPQLLVQPQPLALHHPIPIPTLILTLLLTPNPKLSPNLNTTPLAPPAETGECWRQLASPQSHLNAPYWIRIDDCFGKLELKKRTMNLCWK